jgi:hypothetical protein
MRSYTGEYKGCKVTIYDFGNNTNEEWNNRINKLKGERMDEYTGIWPEPNLKDTLNSIDEMVHQDKECKICGDKDYEIIYLRVCKKCKEGLLG